MGGGGKMTASDSQPEGRGRRLTSNSSLRIASSSSSTLEVKNSTSEFPKLSNSTAIISPTSQNLHTGSNSIVTKNVIKDKITKSVDCDWLLTVVSIPAAVPGIELNFK